MYFSIAIHDSDFFLFLSRISTNLAFADHACHWQVKLERAAKAIAATIEN
jgi:hypothetical protein